MRHARPYRKLSRQRSHYNALMRNLALGLFLNERITTTLAKAKEVRGFIDQIITLAKSGTLHDRRRAFSLLGNKKVWSTEAEKSIDPLQKVFTEFSKRYEKRPGGYTRIIKLGYRPGDGAPRAILELVDAADKSTTKAKPSTAAKATKTPKKASKKKEAAAA